MHRILELLEKNSTLTVSDLAVMLDKSEEEISAAIEQFKKDGIIIGSKLWTGRRPPENLSRRLLRLKSRHSSEKASIRLQKDSTSTSRSKQSI